MNTIHPQSANQLSIQHLQADPKQDIQNSLQIYKIKINNLKPQDSNKKLERNIYLNIKFIGQQQQMTQSQCININKDNKWFQIKTMVDVSKIQVIDYDSLKKLSKISFRGVKKEFRHCHIQEKSQIEVRIERSHADLTFFRKQCKMVKSILVERDYEEQKDFLSTDHSADETSL